MKVPEHGALYRTSSQEMVDQVNKMLKTLTFHLLNVLVLVLNMHIVRVKEIFLVDKINVPLKIRLKFVSFIT